MRVPSAGQPLYERRIVREGRAFAERMLSGYRVTSNGRLFRGSDLPPAQQRLFDRLDRTLRTIAGFYRRVGNGFW